MAQTRNAWFSASSDSLAACGGSGNSTPSTRTTGQTEFLSAPPAGIGSANNGGGGGGAVSDLGEAAAADGGTSSTTTSTTTSNGRVVQETDLYRVDGNRLYYLNSYRGLMVFDITNVDQPTLLGRSAIYGTPIDMLVENGVATVIVSDWYGSAPDGSPFHGSVVRGLDATDPTNIKVLGDAQLGGWVQDSRIVGNVLYTVSLDYGWQYGWDYEWEGNGQTQVIVSSVLFGNGKVTPVATKKYPSYSGIFNVTVNSILLAHDLGDGNQSNTPQTELQYLDITDPYGAIVERGTIAVAGSTDSYGTDSGRWTLDFADGKTAHVVACADYYCDDNGYVLSIADFTNPDAPVLTSTTPIPSPGWSFSSRFVGTRLYLTSDNGDWNGDGTTPLTIYDLSVPTKPTLLGSTTLPGSVWSLIPADNNHMFALGNDWPTSNNNDGEDDDTISLKYVDVSTPTAPQLLGDATFGAGWAWTPAEDTFKAFTMDTTSGLVVLPFSGWTYDNDYGGHYTNGLQLVEFTDTSVKTSGTARTKGWVERGIFANGRLLSLSDLSLAVIDYTNHQAPVVTAELTLARNTIAAMPLGATIAEVSSDWWDNDTTQSELRLLPIANATESEDDGTIPDLTLRGVDAQVFPNGKLTYIVTDAPPCDSSQADCAGPQQVVQVIDLSGSTPKVRGQITLPNENYAYDYWGWYGYGCYDWFEGYNLLQAAPDMLVFRRDDWAYDVDNNYKVTGTLFVVDLSNADKPSIASVRVVDRDAWWGDLQVVGSTLYTTHYEWDGGWGSSSNWVRYYADRIDLSDRANPRVESKINVPGLIIGGSTTDPSLLYTVDYRWTDSNDDYTNDIDVVRVSDSSAQLVSSLHIDGDMGSTFFAGDIAYVSVQNYNENNDTSSVALHAIDLSNPKAPVDRVASGQRGWGWLYGIAGDRAIVESGWGDNGVDIYQLHPGGAPTFDRFVRTRGWGATSLARQGNSIFITTGYWGVERIDLVPQVTPPAP